MRALGWTGLALAVLLLAAPYAKADDKDDDSDKPRKSEQHRAMRESRDDDDKHEARSAKTRSHKDEDQDDDHKDGEHKVGEHGKAKHGSNDDHPRHAHSHRGGSGQGGMRGERGQHGSVAKHHRHARGPNQKHHKHHGHAYAHGRGQQRSGHHGPEHNGRGHYGHGPAGTEAMAHAGRAHSEGHYGSGAREGRGNFGFAGMRGPMHLQGSFAGGHNGPQHRPAWAHPAGADHDSEFGMMHARMGGQGGHGPHFGMMAAGGAMGRSSGEHGMQGPVTAESPNGMGRGVWGPRMFAAFRASMLSGNEGPGAHSASRGPQQRPEADGWQHLAARMGSGPRGGQYGGAPNADRNRDIEARLDKIERILEMLVRDKR